MKIMAYKQYFQDLFDRQSFSFFEKKRLLAIEAFSNQNTSFKKNEDWRYMPMNGLLEIPWQLIDTTITLSSENNHFIFMDFKTACASKKYHDYFEKTNDYTQDIKALNTAFMNQGFLIIIPKNTIIEEPIYIEYPVISQHQMASYRNIIILEEGASATVIESFKNDSDDVYFNHAITEIYVAKNAKLSHYKQQKESTKSFHLSHLHVKQQENTHVETHVVSEKGGWIRSDTHIRLEEEHAHCILNGVTFGKNKQVIDHHTTVEHLKPNGSSDEYYKAILDNEACGIFNGKVIVSPKAIHTNASQSNKSLLLSRGAQMNTKPQLEIFSDDVKCTHGATIGQLDEEALFYLQARGIEKTEAQKLLIDAFLQDVLERMSQVNKGDLALKNLF